jgi:hypothetical protein
MAPGCIIFFDERAVGQLSFRRMKEKNDGTHSLFANSSTVVVVMATFSSKANCRDNHDFTCRRESEKIKIFDVTYDGHSCCVLPVNNRPAYRQKATVVTGIYSRNNGDQKSTLQATVVT